MWLLLAALLGVLSATMVSFHSVSPTAAYLLVPYFGWTLYATGLTLSIYKKNPRVRTSLLRPAAGASSPETAFARAGYPMCACPLLLLCCSCSRCQISCSRWLDSSGMQHLHSLDHGKRP